MSDRELIDAAALRLGTSQAGLARHIGVSKRAINNWAQDRNRRAMPRPARMLLDCIVAGSEAALTPAPPRAQTIRIFGADVEI